MLNSPDYQTARELLLSYAHPVAAERIPLSECGGRILAEPLIAGENVPAFDRSPLDGYAIFSHDTASASKDFPVTLRVLEEVPAGAVPTKRVIPGTAVKILTGAPIPEGADAVIMYEKTVFTAESVTLFSPVKAGDGIVRAGEDVKKGVVLAECGDVIDSGLAGTLASQGNAEPLVYKIPRIAILSTGSELVEADTVPENGKIRNSNRYTLEAAISRLGCKPVYLGIAGDSVREISTLISRGLEECDAVVTTGGVSAGDYDLTPDAMEMSGTEILFRGVAMKPGMACAYGFAGGKPVCGLSGNPASSLTNFLAVAAPMLKKLAGCKSCVPEELSIVLADGFKKKSPQTRFLRGRLKLTSGTVSMELPGEQGNVVISSAIGCNVMAVVPAGSGPIEAGTVLKGFLI